MKNIFILTDYKGVFGSKWNAVPYRSGMDLKILKKEFEKQDYSVKILSFADAANNSKIKKDDYVIYTSTEDIRYYYKDFIEDVVMGLEEKGLTVIPSYKYLRATNNKVFMEILLKNFNLTKINLLESNVYGSLEDIKKDFKKLTFPLVIKEPKGAMSEGVYLVNNLKKLKSHVQSISKTSNFLLDIKDRLRPLRHPNYTTESRYRKKFIVQKLIPNLKNDWKILIFGEKYFIFSRPVRKNDFRASGSGSAQYLFGSNCVFPDGIFDFAKEVFEKMDTPHLSLDVAYDGKTFYIIEFQAVYFGTVGIFKSDVFFKNTNSNWTTVKNNISLEEIYVDSIIEYIKR